MDAKFKIGDHVRSLSSVDCYGKNIPEQKNLVVESVRYIPIKDCHMVELPPPRIPTKGYFRIKAVNIYDPWKFVEAAESFFEEEINPSGIGPGGEEGEGTS